MGRRHLVGVPSGKSGLTNMRLFVADGDAEGKPSLAFSRDGSFRHVRTVKRCLQRATYSPGDPEQWRPSGTLSHQPPGDSQILFLCTFTAHLRLERVDQRI